MSAPVPYLFFPATAREALEFYHGVFGGELTLHTFADFGRDDGPPDAIAHGILAGPVDLFGSDVADDEEPLRTRGLSFALLGAADPATLERWFAALSDGGDVVDPLVERPWGAHDGTVVDRFGVRWLVGYED
ncbi:VOC family protein [Microbacterium rhizophilus]|uniref:VOC family protein n=1 Tax=Microbacterium rhizophilus TaxID=3138934 RepID=UPI0031E62E7A